MLVKFGTEIRFIVIRKGEKIYDHKTMLITLHSQEWSICKINSHAVSIL